MTCIVLNEFSCEKPDATATPSAWQRNIWSPAWNKGWVPFRALSLPGGSGYRLGDFHLPQSLGLAQGGAARELPHRQACEGPCLPPGLGQASLLTASGAHAPSNGQAFHRHPSCLHWSVCQTDGEGPGQTLPPAFFGPYSRASWLSTRIIPTDGPK